MKTAEILDLAKSRANIPSDYALSQKLGCTRSAVSLWRLAKSFPDSLYCTKLADMCGIDAIQVIAWVELERAEKVDAADDVSYWRRYAARGAAAAASLVLGAFLSAPPTPAYSKPLPSVDNNIHCRYLKDTFWSCRNTACRLPGGADLSTRRLETPRKDPP